MPNTYVPTNLRIEQYFSDHALIAWDFPAPGLVPNYTFRVYASALIGGPFLGPISSTPRTKAPVQAQAPANFYVTVSSFDINTSEESAQTAPIFISLEHASDGVGGAIAKSSLGVPKFLHTDEEGKIKLSGSGITVTVDDSSASPFHDFWFTGVALAPNILTLVHTKSSPGPESLYVTGLYVTGQGRCLIELKKAGILVWRGRTNDVDTDLNPVFPESAIVSATGETLEVYINNDNSAPLHFSGNIFGYIK